MKITSTELTLSNPFTIEGIKTQTFIKRGSEKIRQQVDVETGEVYNVVKLDNTSTTVMIDDKKFTKVFDEGLYNISNLTVPEIKVFTYIQKHLLPNKDYLFIHGDECAEWCGYKTTPQIYKGLVGLIEKEIIARGKNNLFWINPNYIYNGNRCKNETYIFNKK